MRGYHMLLIALDAESREAVHRREAEIQHREYMQTHPKPKSAKRTKRLRGLVARIRKS